MVLEVEGCSSMNLQKREELRLPVAAEVELDDQSRLMLSQIHENYSSVAAKLDLYDESLIEIREYCLLVVVEMDLYGESWIQMHEFCLPVAVLMKLYGLDQYPFFVSADLEVGADFEVPPEVEEDGERLVEM